MRKPLKSIDKETLQLLQKVREFQSLFSLMADHDPIKVGEYVRNKSVPIVDVLKLMQWHDKIIRLTNEAMPTGWTAQDEAAWLKIKKQQGTTATIEKKKKREAIAKEIFALMESKGEKLPIKRSEIFASVYPLWKKRTTLKPPKEDTLFDYQKAYLAEKVRKG